MRHFELDEVEYSVGLTSVRAAFRSIESVMVSGWLLIVRV